MGKGNRGSKSALERGSSIRITSQDLRRLEKGMKHSGTIRKVCKSDGNVWWKQVPHSVPVPVLRMIKGGDVGKGCLGMIQIAAPTRQCWQVVCA